jgi:hypothetical protein
MGLNIPLLFDVVKAYYRNNFYPMQFFFQKDDKTKYLGILKDGVTRGEYHEKEKVYLNKTFISYKTANLLSHDSKKELLKTLKYNMDSFNKSEFEFAKKGLESLYKFMSEIEKGFSSEKTVSTLAANENGADPH